MSITTDTRNTLNAEVEGLDREASLLDEWHNEAAQAAVDMQTDLVLVRELAKGNDIVLAAIREVDCRANKL